jgi:hypothetical protein
LPYSLKPALSRRQGPALSRGPNVMRWAGNRLYGDPGPHKYTSRSLYSCTANLLTPILVPPSSPRKRNYIIDNLLKRHQIRANRMI